MSDIATLRDSTVDSAAPGQTFLNFFGEGGRADSSTDEGRELVQDREMYSQWFMVHRPPANDTFGADEETECLIHRIGGDDVVCSATKNREIESKVRTELGRDLDPGEAVMFTGDGTGHAYIDIKPDGDVVMVSNDGGGNTITLTLDASTGNYDLKTSGKVRIGGSSADTPIVRYAELMTLYASMKLAHDNHGHLDPVSGILTGPVTAPGPGAIPLNFPTWDTAIASGSGETD